MKNLILILIVYYNHNYCVNTHTHAHTSLVPLDSSYTCSTAAIVGGIVGGLVALGIMCLLSSIIIIVAVKLSKQGKYS